MVLIGIFQFIFLTCFNTVFPIDVGWGWGSIFILIMFGRLAIAGYKEALAFSTSRFISSDSSAKSGNPNFLVLVTTSLLAAYAYVTYPHISPALGGGNKSPVILLPNSKGIEVSKALALPLNNNQTIGPISILTETEHEIVILVPDGLTEKSHAIRLNRDLFDAIQATHNP